MREQCRPRPRFRTIGRYIIGIAFLALVTPELGWTYVDPGITGMIYQIGFLIIASVSTLLALCGRKIVSWLGRLAFWRVTEGRDNSR